MFGRLCLRSICPVKMADALLVLKIMIQRTANENAACLRRICKRSDQPKIDRLVNNDARLILRRKLNGATTR